MFTTLTAGRGPNFPRNMKSATERTELYDKGIQYEDKYIGELFAALGQRGLKDNTLIIITSDHGESLWQHGLATHGKALYRELIHVPLIVLQPHHVPSGLRVEPLVSTASIPATVLSLIGP